MRGKCERGRGKCERGRGSANADGAGAKAFAGDGYSQKASFGPMAAISRRGQGGRIIIIRVCASYCGECALNPPPSPPIPRRRPSLAPTQRHALPEHFRSPSPPRRTPADLITHSPPKTFARPRSPDARPQAARCIPRRPHSPFPAEDLPSPPHSDTPSPQHFLTPSPPRRPPAGSAMHSSPTSQPIPRRRPCSPPHSDTPFPSTSDHPRSADARPRSADARPQAARCTPAALTTHSPLRHAASPSVPLRAQKNGTAQRVCDAECFGRPSLRSVIWVGEPRAVRRRCGALACRRGA